MPLKGDDLKTVESYKKAMKQEATRISSSGNTKFWVYKDVEMPTAGGSKQKLPLFLALIDDTAVKPLLKGKQPLCRGVCGIKEGKVSFDASQGNLPEALLVKIIPQLLGKPMLVPKDVKPEKQNTKPEKEQKEQEEEEVKTAPKGPAKPPASGPPQSSGRYAQLNGNWKKLSQDANKRIAEHPGLKDLLTKAMEGIPDMLQSGKLPEAEKHIQQLEAALKIPPPPSAPPPPAPGAPGRYAQLNAAWKKIQEAAKKRIAEDPEHRGDLEKVMEGIPDMLRGGQLGEAQKRIEQLQATLKIPVEPPPQPKPQPQAPPPPPPPPPGSKETSSGTRTQTPPSPPPGEQGRAAQLNTQWQQLSKQANQIMGKEPDLRDALAKATSGIPELLRAGQFDTVHKRLQALESLLKNPGGTPEAKAQAALWKRLEAEVQETIAKYPDSKADLVRATAGLGEMIRAGKVGLAAKLMDNVEKVLRRIYKEAEARKPIEERLADLSESWKAIGADVRRAMARFPEHRGELSALVTAVEKSLRDGKPDEADKRIDEAFETVQGLADAQLKFENWYSRMEPIIDTHAKGDTEDANKIRLARGVMQDKVDAGDYEAALEMMERVMDLIP